MPDDDDTPVTANVDEPTADQKAKWQHDSDLGDLINQVRDGLKPEVESAMDKAQQTEDSASNDELSALSVVLQGLAAKGSAAESKLVDAGIGENVYSVQACKRVISNASMAASDAAKAVSADTHSAVRPLLQSIRDHLTECSVAVNGM